MDENSNFRKENEGELSAFSTEHLTVGYDKMPLIKDVNLQVRPGEILTLIGPNGSGKSTILKTITRQLKQIGGTVYLGKETMRGMGDNEVSRRLSMVMTERVRTELMSGREVVASGRYPYTGRLGILSPEDWEKVDEAIAMVHAKEVQEQDFMKSSDGQRQRLMLARAIAQDTKILVLDEPTSYLDMGFKLDILANIRLLARERNLAIVMSLHELDLAQKISDTIACVKGDRIDRIGTPEEIFAGDYVQKLYGVAKENFDPLTGQVFFPKNAQAPKVFVIEIGGGRITGTEYSPEHPEGISFGMYHTGQYAAPDGEHQKVFSADGVQWYKQYAVDTVIKKPFTAPDGEIDYHKEIVKKMPDPPKRKDRM